MISYSTSVQGWYFLGKVAPIISQLLLSNVIFPVLEKKLASLPPRQEGEGGERDLPKRFLQCLTDCYSALSNDSG
jgi:hypothetical protein